MRFLRQHFYWTQTEAAEKIKLASAQYFSTLERKGQRAAFDLATDFVWRLLCARAFLKKASARRKTEAARLIRDLEQVEAVLNVIKQNRAPKSMTIERRRTGWQAPPERLAA